MADKKPRAKGGSKVSSKRPSNVPRPSLVPGGTAAVVPTVNAPDEKPGGVSSWGELNAAKIPAQDAEVPAAPAPVVPQVPLNSLGLPDESLMEKKSFIEEELGGITERLHRALGDIATLYDENGEEKLEPEIDIERRQYMARLEALDDRFRSIEGDREQLLRTLNRNGEMSGMSQEDYENDREMPSPLSSLRERMANTQSGYVKLKELNQQMLMMNRGGKQQQGGLVTEVDVQAKVISRFKEMFQARKTKAVDRTFGSHWKHAAGEIVGLLSKVRQEGEMDIQTMRRALENTEQLISKQVEALARLEERVYDKQEEINKCRKDFSVLESDNVLLKSEVNQYRSSVVELKKKIRKLEAQLKASTASDGTESESDGGAAPTRRVIEIQPATELPSDVRGRRTFKKPRADVTEVKEENEKLIDKVTTLEMKVIEKETKNMRMEHDVSEMLENIRSASPEAIKHLRRSIDLTRYLPEVDADEDDDPSKEVAIDVGESVSPTTGHDSAIQSTPTASHSYSISPTSRSRTAKRTGGGGGAGAGPRPRTPAQVLRDLRSPSHKTDDQTEYAEGSEPTLADFNREREHCTRLASELESVKKELSRAKREIVGLQFGSNRTYAIIPEKTEKTPICVKETDEKSTPSSPEKGVTREEYKPAERVEVPRDWQRRRSSIQPPNVAQLLAKVSPSNANRPSDEKALYEQLKSQGLHNAAPRRNVRVVRQSMTRRKTVTVAGQDVVIEEDEGEEQEEEDDAGAVGGGKGEETLDDEGNVVSFEEYVLVDQGMQTDPVLDPLGAWSNVKSVGMKARKRSASPRRGFTKGPVPLPAPPEEWAQFDPTQIKGPLDRKEDRAHKKGGRSRPGSAVDGIFFVERELSRIITGIRGFTSYVSQLLDREISEIAKRNDEIRSQMSERSLRRFERMTAGPDQPGDDDTTLSGKPTVPPIRRGRFELMRQDNQTSHFANRIAFASYTTGRRSSTLPGTATSSKSATSDVADYYQLFLPIIEHLQCADAEAQRRLVEELRDGKRTMTSCQRYNMEVELVGKHAIDVLGGICDLFRNTVEKQTREHDFLSEGLKMKEELEHALRGGLSQDVPLKAKRSLSHSDFLEPGHTLAGRGISVPPIPVQSKSLSSIESSHRYLPSLMIPRTQAPTNRDEMVVAKTVLPRKGMVRLQAIGVPKSDSKPADQKRGHRPAPQNHHKLQSKQKEAIRRVSNGTGEGANEPTTLKHVLLELQEPDTAPARKPMHYGKDASSKEANRKISGAPGQQTISGVMKAAKRQLNTGELRGKVLTMFSN